MKCVVITTINEPTTAIHKFIDTEYDVIIVGDKKTPNTYKDLNCTFLSIEDQDNLFYSISSLIPYNHYSRKNIGYLYAMKKGYDVIAESDDDNIPYDNWGVPNYDTKTIVSPKYPNIYSLYTDKHIWPRGYPLDYVNKSQNIITENSTKDIYVYQSLVEGDPDVDSIYRLTHPEYGKVKSYFNNNLKSSYVMDTNIWSPFNTQNTFWVNKKAFPFLYIPCDVTFRYCDILKSYIAQKGIWDMGGHVAFSPPSAIQIRNNHDLLDDFKSEIPIFTQFHDVVNKLENSNSDILDMYCNLQPYVSEKELEIVKEWNRFI